MHNHEPQQLATPNAALDRTANSHDISAHAHVPPSAVVVVGVVAERKVCAKLGAFIHH